MIYIVTILAEEIKQCYEFANFAWLQQSQSDKNFGTDPRSKEEFIADQITGKLAEIIFKHGIEQLFTDIQIEVNFEHYLDPLTTDNGDVRIIKGGLEIPLRVDIKGSSKNAQWMLIEEYKYRHLQTKEKVSDFYVMVKFNDDMPTNPDLRKNPNQILNKKSISGEIIGWIKHEDLDCSKDKHPWFLYNRGDRLINTSLIPSTSQKINDLNHLKNYINKVLRENPKYHHFIGPQLQARVNIGFPIKWLNLNLQKLLNY